MPQPMHEGTVLGGRYQITAHVLTSAEQDVVLDGRDQVLNRDVSILVASTAHASQVATSARQLATGERESTVQVLDLGLSDDRTYLIAAGGTDPNDLLSLVTTHEVYVEPFQTDTLGSELFGESRSYEPETYEDDDEYYSEIEQNLAAQRQSGPRKSKFLNRLSDGLNSKLGDGSQAGARESEDQIDAPRTGAMPQQPPARQEPDPQPQQPPVAQQPDPEPVQEPEPQQPAAPEKPQQPEQPDEPEQASVIPPVIQSHPQPPQSQPPTQQPQQAPEQPQQPTQAQQAQQQASEQPTQVHQPAQQQPPRQPEQQETQPVVPPATPQRPARSSSDGSSVQSRVAAAMTTEESGPHTGSIDTGAAGLFGAGGAFDYDDDAYEYHYEEEKDRSAAGKWIGAIILLLILVVAVVLAFKFLGSAADDEDEGESEEEAASTPSPSEEESEEPSEEPSESPSETEEPLPEPSVSGLSLSVPENPELQSQNNEAQVSEAADGSTATAWHSLSYASPDFGGFASSMQLIVELEEESDISDLSITQNNGSGGSFQIYVSDSPAMEDGTSIAEGSFTGPTYNVPISDDEGEPMEGEYVIINFTELPALSDPNATQPYGMRIAEIEVN